MRAGVPPWVRASRAHVFVDDLDAPVLGEDDRHHLLRVLRLRSGEAVSAADGNGAWRAFRLDGDRLVAAGPKVLVARSEPMVTVAFAVPKGDRADWAVQKLTEVGVDRIVPLLADRAAVRWDAERAARHLTRWRSIARQAAMQSRRAWAPTIGAPRRVGELASAGTVALADPDGTPPDLARPVALVGPEGGWSEGELALGLPLLTLGATVLRTETAAVLAGALLVSLRSGVVAACGANRRGQP